MDMSDHGKSVNHMVVETREVIKPVRKEDLNWPVGWKVKEDVARVHLETHGYTVVNVQKIIDDWERGPHLRVVGQRLVPAGDGQ